MVGTAGFEPATTTPPVWCATRLRYAPNFFPAHHSVVRLSATIRAALRPEFFACTPQCGATFYNNQGCTTPRSFSPAHHSVVRLSTTIRAALRPEFFACTPQCGATFCNNQGCTTPRIFSGTPQCGATFCNNQGCTTPQISTSTWAGSPARSRLYAI
jgi:hypothetical protein